FAPAAMPGPVIATCPPEKIPVCTPTSWSVPGPVTISTPYPPPASARRAVTGTASTPLTDWVASDTWTGTPAPAPVAPGRLGRTVSTSVALVDGVPVEVPVELPVELSVEPPELGAAGAGPIATAVPGVAAFQGST